MSQQPPVTKITVLISGNGSNLQALIDAAASQVLPSVKIIRVISNKKTAYGLTRAEKASIPTLYHNLIAGKFLRSGETDPEVKQKARETYDAALAEKVLQDEPDLVVCAGWMHILAPTFLDPLSAHGVPVINLHPALPGRYDGAGAIQRAFDDFQKGTLENGRTGVMVHYVVAKVDSGEVIVQEEIPCKVGETLEQLEGRIHEIEHSIIVRGTDIAASRIREKKGR